MRKGSKKQRLSSLLPAVLLTVTLLGLTGTLTGCAVFAKKIVIHPLVDDFQLVQAGETVTAKKQGALVSDYWISQVAGVSVEQ